MNKVKFVASDGEQINASLHMAMYYYATKLSMVACVAGCRRPRRRRSHSTSATAVAAETNEKSQTSVDIDHDNKNYCDEDETTQPIRKVSKKKEDFFSESF